MCGIVAIWSYGDRSPSVDSDELTRIRDHMASRGPDGRGEWFSRDQKVGLGHRRLAILDLSRNGAQPMLTPDQKLVITFNGEIYNFKTLRAQLETKGYLFYSNTDTEVLLYLYREYGQKMVEHLRGMFAFALWDESKKSLLLARDPFGIKPLYYSDDGNTLRVASQVKALLSGGKINTTPDPAGHTGYFLWGCVPEPYTLYKEIREFPAGTTLEINSYGKKEVHAFFSVSKTLSSANDAPKYINEGEQREVLRKSLLDSIKQHLVSDVPVGLFLSSGLDSCTILALASEIGTSPIHTITLGFQEYRGTEFDETPLAEQMAHRYGTNHQTIWVSKKDFQSDFKSLMKAMDQPTIDGVNSYFVSKAASQTGLKVCLTGIGGDELFRGYSSFREIPRFVRRNPFKNIPFLGKIIRWCVDPVLGKITSPKYAGLIEYGNNISGAYLLRRSFCMPWEIGKFLDSRSVNDGLRELQVLQSLESTISTIQNDQVKISALETTWYMRNQLLRDSDWAGMAHSLEIRTPFIDIELLKKIAPFYSNDKGIDKLDMADTPLIKLPEEILNRKKTGFSVPVHEWLMEEKRNKKWERGLRRWARKIYSEQFQGKGSIT